METLNFPIATFFHTMHQHTAPDGAEDGNDTPSFQALLLQSDAETDRDLDLALSIIHELDVSLIEPGAFDASAVTLASAPASPASPPATTATPDNEMQLLHALYQGDVRSNNYGIVDTNYTLDSYAHQAPFLSSASAFFELPLTSIASSAAAAPLKRKEKRCTYQNRRAEIHVLRDQVVALESQVRKLKHRKTRRRHNTPAASSSRASVSPIAELEAENAELKAAVLAQKAQLNSLIERLQAQELLVVEPSSDDHDDEDDASL